MTGEDARAGAQGLGAEEGTGIPRAVGGGVAADRCEATLRIWAEARSG